MTNEMIDKKLYLVKLLSAEYVIGEYNEGDLISCFVLNPETGIDKTTGKSFLYFDFYMPFQFFNDDNLYDIENIKGKISFVKEIKELEILNKNYYDYRLARFNNENSSQIIMQVII